MTINPIILTQKLIQYESVTPCDKGCLSYISTLLETLGFACKTLNFGDVSNIYARIGDKDPVFCFLGHVDVVPAVDEQKWRFSPFSGTLANNLIYGRGAVDMKGGIAAFIAAVEQFSSENHNFNGSIAFILTSDEEGIAEDGTKKVIKHLKEQGENITMCLVGEPTSCNQIGDTVKIGARGSLNVTLRVEGRGGHVAHPHMIHNPLIAITEHFSILLSNPLDKGTEFFEPSNIQITSFDAVNPVTNMVPNKAEVKFNVRFNPVHTVENLIKQFKEIANNLPVYYRKNFSFEFAFKEGSFPYLSDNKEFLQIFTKAIQKVTKTKPKFNTKGATSDARFLKGFCPTFELGLRYEKAHSIDECVLVDDLYVLTEVYKNILDCFFKSLA
ncbi:MAG: succinyl-diaminopimelate desuccinylase [Alphaproteobacteria bacterium]